MQGQNPSKRNFKKETANTPLNSKPSIYKKNKQNDFSTDKFIKMNK